VSHRMSHRLRIKIPSRKGDESYFSRLRERLAECPGIEHVRVNPGIGTTLIVHSCTTKELVEFAKKKHLFELKRVVRAPATLFGNMAKTFEGYNKNLRTWTDGELDIQSLVFLSLLVSGIWEVARGNLTMPAWYTAFYYALGVFTRSQMDELDEGTLLVTELDEADLD